MKTPQTAPDILPATSTVAAADVQVAVDPGRHRGSNSSVGLFVSWETNTSTALPKNPGVDPRGLKTARPDIEKRRRIVSGV